MAKHIFSTGDSVSIVRLLDTFRSEQLSVFQADDVLPKAYHWTLNIYPQHLTRNEAFIVVASSPRELKQMLSEIRQQIDEMEDIVYIPRGCGVEVRNTETTRYVHVYGPEQAQFRGLATAESGDMLSN